MEAAEAWASEDGAGVEGRASGQGGPIRCRRPPLADSLMRSCLIEKTAVFVEHLLQLHFAHGADKWSSYAEPAAPFRCRVRADATMVIRDELVVKAACGHGRSAQRLRRDH